MVADATVSAVVVAHNGGDALIACVDSLMRQTLVDLEVIVVDNASTDGSVDRLKWRFNSGLRVIPRQSNGGYAVAANTGWKGSDAPFVAILNQDVTLEADCIAQMLRVLIEAGRDALVSPKLVLTSDPTHINAIGNDVHLSGVSWCRGLGTAAADWQGIEEVTAISGAAFMATRHLLEQLKGLDESFFMYMEDVDLSLRARLVGAICLVACDAVAAHDWSLALTPSKFGYLERNRRRVWDRHIGPGGGRSLVLLQVEAMGWMYAALRGRAHVAAKWHAYRASRVDRSIAIPNPGAIVPLLSTRYPYDVLFPHSRAIGLIGRAIDRLVAVWLYAIGRTAALRGG